MAGLIAVVEAGPLYAAADSGDEFYDSSLEVLSRGMYSVIAALVVWRRRPISIGEQLGARAEARFLTTLSSSEVQAHTSSAWSPISGLVDQYSSLPLGGSEARPYSVQKP